MTLLHCNRTATPNPAVLLFGGEVVQREMIGRSRFCDRPLNSRFSLRMLVYETGGRRSFRDRTRHVDFVRSAPACLAPGALFPRFT
jgi:hypothetical protein